VEAESRVSAGSYVDQSLMLSLRGKALFYQSSGFTEDLEVSGFFELRAWISIDCPDTDLYASIYEVTTEGNCIRLTTDAIRARYRQGLRSPKLINTTSPLSYEFARFTFISKLIRRGHRLRLMIAPVGRLIDGLFTERNFNAGGTAADESILDARPVTVKLFHEADYPSVLRVPIGR